MHLIGYIRAFCGVSKTWGNTSPSTILQTGRATDRIEGLAVALTDEQIQKFNPYVGYPKTYNHFAVSMVTYDKQENGSFLARNI